MRVEVLVEARILYSEKDSNNVIYLEAGHRES